MRNFIRSATHCQIGFATDGARTSLIAYWTGTVAAHSFFRGALWLNTTSRHQSNIAIASTPGLSPITVHQPVVRGRPRGFICGPQSAIHYDRIRPRVIHFSRGFVCSFHYSRPAQDSQRVCGQRGGITNSLVLEPGAGSARTASYIYGGTVRSGVWPESIPRHAMLMGFVVPR